MAAENDWVEGNFYGSLREQVAFYNDDGEFQDNSSRIGTMLFYNRDSTKLVHCHIEWSLKLVGSEVSFNADANQGQDLNSLLSRSDDKVIGARLGYFGLRRKWGWLTIGKQWSVYSKVARMADHLNVYGGEANGCFTARTDGGSTGNGRADRVIALYLERGSFTLGLQQQMKGDTPWLLDGGGAMIKYKASDVLSVGGAFNLTKINQNDFEAAIIDVDEDGSAFALGVSYDTKPIKTAVVVSRQDNIGVAVVGTSAAFYDATGLEFYLSYRLSENLSLHGGVVSLWPERDSEDLLDDDFKTQYLALGFNAKILEGAMMYVEGKLNNGTLADGSSPVDVIAVGFKTDFSFKTEQRFK